MDFGKERLIFDWRSFGFIAPVEEDLNYAASLENNPELYPRIYGYRCLFSNGVEIILTENLKGDHPIWFFPLQKNLWKPTSHESRIYSMEQSPPGTFPSGCADSLTLAYEGKNTKSITNNFASFRFKIEYSQFTKESSDRLTTHV